LKPEDVLGAGIGAHLLLGRTPDAAIAVTNLLAYPMGFEFTVGIVVRRRERYGLEPWMGPRQRHEHPDGPPPDDFVRLGVQFSDGGAATNVDGHPFSWTDEEPTGPVLMPDTGSGGDRRYDMTFWVWPLPPPGPVAFVCEWPARGIPESRAEIDAQLILDASALAVRLWET
jgi:hypothetical protein